MTVVRIATFNVENLDETEAGVRPSLAERITLMRPQVERLRSDVVCFQEVHGQERPGQPRALLALRELLATTHLDTHAHTLTSTKPSGDAVYDKRNLVVATRFPVLSSQQLRYKLVPQPKYKRVTANPPDKAAKAIGVERPIQHVQLDLGLFGTLNVINVHFKSKIPSEIPGQKVDSFTWRSADAWAEGLFVSSMKRMSQAVEVRRLVDQIFDADADAKIVVAGDFNAEPDEIPVLAIRGDVEDTGNGDLANRVLVPIEHSVPEPSRYTLFHHGRGELLDHMLVSRNLLAYYSHSEIHNELLHDESIAFAVDQKFPESDHAPMVAEFDFPNAT